MMVYEDLRLGDRLLLRGHLYFPVEGRDALSFPFGFGHALPGSALELGTTDGDDYLATYRLPPDVDERNLTSRADLPDNTVVRVTRETFKKCRAWLSKEREHCLKTWPEFWDAVARGEKTFEVRRGDRGFKVGDTLVLEKWDSETGHYVSRDLTGGGELQVLRRRVSYVLPGGQLGIEPGYVVLGLKE
jgi:hypothetical protein